MRNRKTLPIELEQEIIRRYKSGESAISISKTNKGIGQEFIARLLRRNNVEIRKRYYASRRHSVNEKYFSKIDSAEKAYFLGWMFSDGCNFTKGKLFHLTIHKNDVEIIKQFKTALQAEHPIRHSRNVIGITVCSEKMSEDLTSLGCVSRKSLILDWPVFLPEEFDRFFIRGYFEGDGCISINGKHTHFSIMSSVTFIEKLQQKILRHTGIEFKTIRRNKNGVLYGGSRKKIKPFFDWLYSGAETLRLARKFDKCMSIKV